ncbi:hypothetical protein [Dermatophilus congolensis]|uniref:hypothetical protein n=1 Tax=Dermatophilus congolensis TaxID=1863 RepID=UPI001AAF029A|nr:hypothetical protein [Dermatophilus congolensis]MBO3143723.1 hypothetical protein [Dermatophilus congolensis]MBO3152714.1 hypothetical protein [Dermatophilus congolensis]MBO3160276.1 hypothetical protein [Dermatophilus congolensis]MBO3163998.1 hypothetical protein [Dermatophilus congolensis]MBO3177544.1 hypothetical protein [Dermatophilus congolensis]
MNPKIKFIAFAISSSLLFSGYSAPSASAAEPSVNSTLSSVSVKNEASPGAERALLEVSSKDFSRMSESEIRTLASQISEGLSQIPKTALQSEEAWQKWRKSVLSDHRGGVERRSISWSDAAKCAGGIAVAAAGTISALGVAKRLITVAQDVGKLYNVMKRAQVLYKTYRAIKAKRHNALRLAIYDAFKEQGGKALADTALQLFFGVSAGTVAACLAAVKGTS